ncbi:calpain-like cysteine peptidase [Trypanosoma grayi]|uniref:calpain-like cysteine peptidase n=1 Tax=Trypanosoma grayi TaxID=71804 RepID=UPI0004F3FD58|nr:calpain-like cysteine peptidase [Trypanosoma grayi]KEG09209.1 calpain-like cysteine peptidase [Trypanosoma grayi]
MAGVFTAAAAGEESVKLASAIFVIPDASSSHSGAHQRMRDVDLTSYDSSDCGGAAGDMKEPATLHEVGDYFAYSALQGDDIVRLDGKGAALQDHAQLPKEASSTKSLHEIERTNTFVLKSSTTTLLSGMRERRRSSVMHEALKRTDDEFDDVVVTTERPCCCDADFGDKGSAESIYRYATPSVAGTVTPVFHQGFLYKIVTDAGDWFFFNDTMKYKMTAHYRFGGASKLVPGPKTTMEQLPSGEYEAQLLVMPCDTEAFVSGEVSGFKNLSTAELVTADFRNVHVEGQNAVILAELDEIAYEAGKVAAEMTEKEALQACWRMKNDTAFIDPIFPPCHRSLFRPGIDAKFLCALPWRRPHEYLPAHHTDECRLFRGGVLPQDPCLGEGGDAYLVSAMSIAAEFPAKVREMFEHPRSDAEGMAQRRQNAYHVTCCYGGWWTTVLLDDYLPSSNHGPVFARCDNDLRKLWVPLLQKAYAKLYGSYAAIQYGDSLEPLQDFLGFPIYRFDEEWATAQMEGVLSASSLNLFLFVESRQHMGCIVCFCTPEEGPPDAPLQQNGLRFGMSYYVMDTVRYGGFRLVKVRCTTAAPGWKGMWAPQCGKWEEHKDLRRLCEVDKEGSFDGALWLEWSEALELFDGGGVCFTRFAYHDYRVRGTFEGGIASVALVITVDHPMEAYCMLSQKDDRGEDPSDPNAALAAIALCVTRSDEGAEAQQRPFLYASMDPDTPTTKQTFIIARDAALHYRFVPKYSPYYIIPCVRERTASTPYTIGLLPSRLIGDASRVSFVRLTSGVLESLASFDAPGNTPVETDYQIRQTTGIVEERRGTELCDDRCANV